MNHHEPHKATPQKRADGHSGHPGHGWMMIACCIPMIAIAIAIAVAIIGIQHAIIIHP